MKQIIVPKLNEIFTHKMFLTEQQPCQRWVEEQATDVLLVPTNGGIHKKLAWIYQLYHSTFTWIQQNAILPHIRQNVKYCLNIIHTTKCHVLHVHIPKTTKCKVPLAQIPQNVKYCIYIQQSVTNNKTWSTTYTSTYNKMSSIAHTSTHSTKTWKKTVAMTSVLTPLSIQIMKFPTNMYYNSIY